MNFDTDALRQRYPALSGTVHGHKLVYLDNAATAQMPLDVTEAVRNVELRRGNVHRGIHALSEECTKIYEDAREVIARHIGAFREQIQFTSGTTDGINRVAQAVLDTLKPGDRIAVTRMDHHSNFVPWQQICLRTGAEFVILPLTEDGDIDFAKAERLLNPGVRLVAVPHVSNVLGTVNDIGRLAKLTHAAGGALLVDGAQGICHEPVDVQENGCDYYAFSGHKMGAPFGIGALYSRIPMTPVRFGGGMVDEVSDFRTTFAKPPFCWEAGTPNVSGAAGLAAAVKFYESLPDGWREWEESLISKLENGLRGIDRLRVLGNPGKRSGCLSFTADGCSPYDLAMLLDRFGIAVRSGHHCAQPLMRSLGTEYALRVSVAFYNTPGEIETFLDSLEKTVSLCRGIQNMV